MNDKSARPEAPPSPALRWPGVAVTVLAGVVASGFVLVQVLWALQFYQANGRGNEMSLATLDYRATQLESVTNWVQRDYYCVPLSAFSRNLGEKIAPDARVFVAGMLGPTNFPKTGYYYSVKNYLFPREVAISLDGRATSGIDGFYGVPCDSPEVLQSNGFDLMIQFTDKGPDVLPLTAKGEPRSE